MNEVFASTILGDTDFIEHVKKSFVRSKETDKNVPASKMLNQKVSMVEIIEAVNQEFPDDKLGRDIKQYLCRKYTPELLKTIGNQFGVSESAVSHAVCRMSKTIANNKSICKKVDKLIDKVNISRFKT